MSRLLCTLFLLAVGAACVSAQGSKAATCTPLGGKLFSVCSKELAYLNTPGVYPLSSTEAPDDAKVMSVIAGIPSGLPTDACCAAVKQFDTAGCGCEGSLASSLSQVGLESTPTGLQGVTKISAQSCKFTPYVCPAASG
ncbi:hypothetical protein ABPG75_004680 [Micractinium tetrahymenae]